MRVYIVIDSEESGFDAVVGIYTTILQAMDVINEFDDTLKIHYLELI